jgi:hypothetical protein
VNEMWTGARHLLVRSGSKCEECGHARYIRFTADNGSANCASLVRATPRAAPTPPQQFPRWYKNDRNQATAEWLAFNFYIDRLAGREPSADIEPYSQFKRSTVEGFLKRLREETGSRAIVGRDVPLMLA